ncbi:hypothetical protein [Atlantibacter hermannii]|uniref:hypothetical protein n=1 Tax=Atlantibacter hermannii TaxID=565 RepID=UPI0028983D84|nr:hypothetical protein [Atlantibacter hermannii]
MGVKQIWDGNQLPPIGCDVLIHLASINQWVPRRVVDYEIKPSLDGDAAYHRIFITVEGNSRLLKDVRPIDWREEQQQ